MNKQLKEWLDRFEPVMREFDPDARVFPSMSLPAGTWVELFKLARLGAALEQMPVHSELFRFYEYWRVTRNDIATDIDMGPNFAQYRGSTPMEALSKLETSNEDKD